MIDALDLFALLLIGLAVVNIGSTAILVHGALRHRWPALEERATVAVILAVAATFAAMLGLGRLHVIAFDNDAVLILLVLCLTGLSLPSIIWLIGYLSGRFDEA